MTKQKNIQKYFNQEEKLTLKNKVYFNQVKRYLTNCLIDDLGDKGDVTSDTLIKGNPKAEAIIFAKQAGIVAGIEEIRWLTSGYGLWTMDYKKDGNKIKKGEKIIKLAGEIKTILKLERTILNLLQRMSGIATETARLARLCPNTLVCSTRKTPLGLLDKKAVTVGGGGTHRLGLYDWILIKDNHLEITNSKFQIPKTFCEIETKNKREALQMAKLNPGAIMLDNMTPKQIKNIVQILNKKYPKIIIEASGMINGKNIKQYAKSDVGVISLGYLTHSTKALDISLEIL